MRVERRGNFPMGGKWPLLLLGSEQERISINLMEAPRKPNEVIIRDYGEWEGLVSELVRWQVVEPPHRWIASGHVQLPVCYLKSTAEGNLTIPCYDGSVSSIPVIFDSPLPNDLERRFHRMMRSDDGDIAKSLGVPVSLIYDLVWDIECARVNVALGIEQVESVEAALGFIGF